MDKAISTLAWCRQHNTLAWSNGVLFVFNMFILVGAASFSGNIFKGTIAHWVTVFTLVFFVIVSCMTIMGILLSFQPNPVKGAVALYGICMFLLVCVPMFSGAGTLGAIKDIDSEDVKEICDGIANGIRLPERR